MPRAALGLRTTSRFLGQQNRHTGEECEGTSWHTLTWEDRTKTCVAILSLEDLRDTQRRAVIRPWLHDRLTPWLNSMKTALQDRTPTLEELTQAVFALRQELTQAVTKS